MTEAKIGTMEAFDCDVEAALDQITQDEKIRGQIRWMVMTNVMRSGEIERELKKKVSDSSERVLQLSTALRCLMAEPNSFVAIGKAHEALAGETTRQATNDALPSIDTYQKLLTTIKVTAQETFLKDALRGVRGCINSTICDGCKKMIAEALGETTTQVVHLNHSGIPFKADCGADEPNQSYTLIRANATCPACTSNEGGFK